MYLRKCFGIIFRVFRALGREIAVMVHVPNKERKSVRIFNRHYCNYLNPRLRQGGKTLTFSTTTKAATIKDGKGLIPHPRVVCYCDTLEESNSPAWCTPMGCEHSDADGNSHSRDSFDFDEFKSALAGCDATCVESNYWVEELVKIQGKTSNDVMKAFRSCKEFTEIYGAEELLQEARNQWSFLGSRVTVAKSYRYIHNASAMLLWEHTTSFYADATIRCIVPVID